MSLRSFLWFTASTILGCTLLIVFFDRPLAWLTHRHLAGTAPFFGVCTVAAEAAYDAVIIPQLFGLPALFVGLLGGFLLVRVLLRRRWGSVFLLVLLTHMASEVSANGLKVLVHRLRPEVLFGAGYAGLGLGQPGPNNDSFPSTHVAVFFSLFWPCRAFAYPCWCCQGLSVSGGSSLTSTTYLMCGFPCGWLSPSRNYSGG